MDLGKFWFRGSVEDDPCTIVEDMLRDWYVPGSSPSLDVCDEADDLVLSGRVGTCNKSLSIFFHGMMSYG